MAEIWQLSALEIAAAIADKKVSSREVVEAHLARIEAVNPAVNAIVRVLADDARKMADGADRAVASGVELGALHGVPFTIKDNIDVAGLGKTNLSEWANFRSTRSSSGWSSRGGQTKNPYVLDRNPCGSSSGTGASIAASLAAVGVGTETDGSIICPASVNGLAGLKPTDVFVVDRANCCVGLVRLETLPCLRHVIPQANQVAVDSNCPHRNTNDEDDGDEDLHSLIPDP